MTTAKTLFLSSVEPLESRIAPALLVYGANLLGGDSPSSGETSVGGNAVTLVKMLAGRALVWFDGVNITGISVGPGAKLEVTGNVAGDIIGNLTASGVLSDSDNNPANGEDGGVLLPNDILGIKFRPLSSEKGSVGNIITGGSVSNLEITGTINGIYAGDGVYRAESTVGSTGIVTSDVDMDINPVIPGIQTSFFIASSDAIFKAGASIAGAKITTAENLQVFAGNGSPDGSAALAAAKAGGSISGISIGTAYVAPSSPVNTPSYFLRAGDGGNGKIGGAGGSIFSIIENFSSGPVVFRSGEGGIGVGGAGGAGGNILDIDLQSASAQYNVTSGNGGSGTPGGAGGKIANGSFTNRTPIAGVIVSADFNDDGYDDVLVADSGTGLMVLNASLGAGGGFAPVAQNDTDITIIGVGAGPVDSLASDIDGDTDLDVLVLYRDGTMATYINNGAGNFYNSSENRFNTQATSVGFIPTKFAEMIPGSHVFGVAENTEGRGILHGVSFFVEANKLKAETFQQSLKYSRPIADLAGDYVGLIDGTIEQYQTVLRDGEDALDRTRTLPGIGAGGLDDLDLDASGTRLLALSSVGRTVTVFDVSGLTVGVLPTISLASIPGKALSAKFVNDFDGTTDDPIVVLSNSVSAAQFTQFTGPDSNLSPTGAYAPGSTYESQTLLKNFAPVYNPGQSSFKISAIAGPLNKFVEVSNFASEQEYSLPFASKQVELASGNGGLGVDVGTKLGKGGAGGGIVNVNIDAQKITVFTGTGGDSNNGPAGDGGSFSNVLSTKATQGGNAGTFKTAGGALVVPRLVAEAIIEITVGNGGSPLGVGSKTASGGAGGGMVGLDITLTAGDVILTTGNGGVGKGAAGGAGGNITTVAVLAKQGALTAFGGQGGNALGAAGNGGAGGTISGLKYVLALDANGETIEDSYVITLTSGNGGSSLGGIGGAGGGLANVSLLLDGPDRSLDNPDVDPPTVDTHRDSTIIVTATAGNAGSGAKTGGAGGSISNFVSQSIFDQKVENGLYLNYVVVNLFAGDGGAASAGNGGAGGSVLFTKPISGVTEYDPDFASYDPGVAPLVVHGGDGGSGSIGGGVGGSISGLLSQNSATIDLESLAGNQLFGAELIAGDGGDGGTGNGGLGGNVKDTQLGVFGGGIILFGGHGGDSANAKGGAGGAVTGGEVGLVRSALTLGMAVFGGHGGDGKTAGGLGGAISTLRINTPQSTDNLAAILLAGDGGAASGATAVGGKGGDVSGITQAKDYNSSINLIQAGDGGDNLLGKAGAGGNVLNIRTVGFIGRPTNETDRLGIFDELDGDPLPQGVFSGRGGDGLTDGINGSITNVVARQIAAMAAAIDANTGLFAAASKITNVTASVIGFDQDLDNTFDTEGLDGASPVTTVPIDGFILANSISKVIGGRPAFTFIV